MDLSLSTLDLGNDEDITQKICSYCRSYVYFGFFYKCQLCPDYYSCHYCLLAGMEVDPHNNRHVFMCVPSTTDQTLLSILNEDLVICPFCSDDDEEAFDRYTMSVLHHHVHSVHCGLYHLREQQLNRYPVPYNPPDDDSDSTDSTDNLIASLLLEDELEKGMTDAMENEKGGGDRGPYVEEESDGARYYFSTARFQ